MTLKYIAQVPGSGEVQKETRITFDPPLSGYEEVKGRLMQMKADAEESLGMVCPLTRLCCVLAALTLFSMQHR